MARRAPFDGVEMVVIGRTLSRPNAYRLWSSEPTKTCPSDTAGDEKTPAKVGVVHRGKQNNVPEPPQWSPKVPAASNAYSL